jgi:hypothetical protein
MSNLVKKEQELANNGELAKQIYAYCSMITPAYFNSKGVAEVKNEIKSIEFLIKDIDFETLKSMVSCAMDDYKNDKSKNPKLIFDIHYILSKYSIVQTLRECGYKDYKDVTKWFDEMTLEESMNYDI